WSGAGQLEKYASVPVIPQQRLGSSDLTSSSARRCFDASTSKMPPQQSHGLLDRFDELLGFGAHGVGISWRRRDSRDGELTPQASRRGWRSKLTRRAKLDRGSGAWPKPPRLWSPPKNNRKPVLTQPLAWLHVVAGIRR